MELQELDEDQDTHLCLNCKTTIPGLLNYVKHKQQECSSLKKALVSLSMDGPTIVSKNVSENAEFSHFGKKKSEKAKTTIQLYPPSTSLTEVGNIFESSSDEEVWGMNVDYVDDAEEERRSYGDSCDVRTGKNRDILEFVTKNTTGKKATEQNEIVEDSTNLRNCLKIEEDTVSDLCQNSKGEPLTLQYTDMHCATHTGLIKRKQDKPMKRKRNKSKRHRFKISQKFVNSIHDDPESCKKSPKSGLFKQKPKQMQKKITTAKDPFKCEYCTQSFIDMAGYMKHKENEHLDEVENGRSYGGMKLRRLKKKINKMDELTSVVYESEAMRERDTPGSDQETSAYMGALGLQSSKTQEKTQTSPKSNKSEDNKLVEDISKSIDEQNPENEESEMEVGTTQVGGKISSLIHCSECEYSSESIYSVQNHIKEKHDDDQMDSLLQWRQNEDVSKCDVCNSLILSCRLQHHYKSKIHRKRVLKQSGAGPLEKCTTCSKAFYLPEDVTIHMKQHVGKNVIKCLICKMKFRNKDELSTHQATDDHIQLQKWEAKSHELQVTSRKECMNKVTKLVMVDGKCRYRCNICQSVLGSKGVQAHIYSHTGDRPFKCPMCEQTYKLREDLNLHIKCHLGIKEKKCPHCDFSTVRSGCLKRHIDAIHNKGQEKNFICEICGARFYSSSLLKTHTQSHTGVRPFTCPYKGCIYAGRHKVELRYHMDTHTGERLFLCDMCGYGGKTKHALTKHRRTHSGEKPFKCDFTGCDYASTVCSHLKRHKRKHMGSKPYKCPYCDHRTANIENMHKHISKTNKHQGKKLFNCPYCKEYSTNVSVEFRSHVHWNHKPICTTDVMSIIAGIYNPEDDCLPSENSTVTAEKMKQSKVRQDASPSAASNKEVAFVPPNVMETDAATASSGVRDISGDRVNDKNSLPVTVFKTVEVVTENDHQSNVENDDYSMCSQEMTRPDALCNGDGFQTKEQMAFLEIMQLTTSTQPTTTSTSNLSISNPNVTVQNLPTVTLSTLNRVENSCYMSLPSSHTGDDEVSVIQELHANVPPIVHTMKESTRVNQQQSLSQNDRLNQTQITVDDDDNDLFLSPFTMTPEK